MLVWDTMTKLSLSYQLNVLKMEPAFKALSADYSNSVRNP